MALLQRIKTPFSETPAEDAGRPHTRIRSVGELLRERREELDLDFDGIGDTLRIKPAYLVALEQGRSHELPGPAYAIGFIRAYAHYLGLDEDAVLARFKEEASVLTARPDLALPVPLGERSLPGAAMLLIAAILVLCGYGTWYYLSTGERTRPERVAAVPPALLAPPIVPGGALPMAKPGSGDPTVPASAPPPGAAASPAGPALGAAPGASGPAVPSAGPGASPAIAARPPTATPPAPPPAAGPPSEPAAPGATSGAESPARPTARNPAPAAVQPQPVAATPPRGSAPAAAPVAAPGGPRIAIRALADCWIQVRAADQSIVYSRVLKSGEIYKVPAKPGLFLRTGNAGALEIAVDGKPAPSIGGVGTLRRNVVLEPDALIAGTAVHG